MNPIRMLLVSIVLALGSSWAVTPLTSVHPDWTLFNLRPAGFTPHVSGLEFLSNGNLVVGHWGGLHANVQIDQNNSIVYIMSGVTGNNPTPVVSTFATGITDLMGLAVVNDQIYVSGGNRIVQLLDANNDGVSDGTRNVISFPYSPGVGIHQRHEFTFGLTHRAGTFYVNLSSTKLDLTPADLIRSPNRGVCFSVNATTGVASTIASGLREPTGLAFGPNGDLFTNDVAGNWIPTCKLTHVQQGHFYGFHHTPDAAYPTLPIPPYESQPETPPAVFMPDEDMASAPSNPLYVTTGPYAGQFLMGDVHYGGINRYFLEKVNGQYQGAAFQFTGGLEIGMFRLAWGPDGMLYAGGLADDGDWLWAGSALKYGLQKLRYDGGTTFEIMAVRSRPTGLEIEFNKPVGASASVISNYIIQSFYVTPTIAYTNNKLGVAAPVPTAIPVSTDQKKVFLTIPGFSAGRVYWVRLPSVRASDNEIVWTREFYYANNAVGSGNPFDPPTPVDPGLYRAGLLNQLKWSVKGNQMTIRTPFQGPYQLRIRDIRGVLLASAAGVGSQPQTLTLPGASRRFAVIEASGDGVNLRRSVALP